MLSLLVVIAASLSAHAAVSCTTESQMTPVQRATLAAAARTMAVEVQQGNVGALRQQTIPPVAQDFSGIASTVQVLQLLIAKATITVDDLYLLDALQQAPGISQTDFSCGLPGSLLSVGLSFHNLPPGQYALAITHATGVAQPQQITLVLQHSALHRWMLAGFFTRPMTMAGHDGIWYWTQARAYAQRKMDWNAWLYDQAAQYLLVPVDFLTSPNLEELRHEAAGVGPEGLPDAQPMLLHASGETFAITTLRPSDEFGPLDLSVHYQPDAPEAAALNDPVAARRQVMQVAQALLAAHPELQVAFHGIWMQARHKGSSIFALELPMSQIVPLIPSKTAPASAPAAVPLNPAVH